MARPATTIAMVRYGRGSLRTNRSISTQKTGDVCADARHEADGVRAKEGWGGR